MNRRRLQARQRVEALIQIGDDLLVDADRAKAEWANFLTIVICGYIEISFREMVYEYAVNKSHPAVANFVYAKMKDIQNPNPGRIEDGLSLFDASWKKRLMNYWEGEQRDALSSLVGLRNKAAHGENAGATLLHVKAYFKEVEDAMNFIEKEILGVR